MAEKNLYDQTVASQAEVTRLQGEKKRIDADLAAARKKAIKLRSELLVSLGRKPRVRRPKAAEVREPEPDAPQGPLAAE